LDPDLILIEYICNECNVESCKEIPIDLFNSFPIGELDLFFPCNNCGELVYIDRQIVIEIQTYTDGLHYVYSSPWSYISLN